VLGLFFTYVQWPSTLMGVLMTNYDNLTSSDPSNVCIGQCHTFKCIEFSKINVESSKIQ
jgi:hypothetical protein